MTLDEFIAREIRLAKEERTPNALSLGFVQLHENTSRSNLEEMEYQRLLASITSRWRWFQASSEVKKKHGK